MFLYGVVGHVHFNFNNLVKVVNASFSPSVKMKTLR